MSFQIKDFASTTASMINHAKGVTKKVTDYQPGSVVRTVLEAPAVEIEELYLQMFLGLRDAIPVATFRSFSFDLLPAARAVGSVSISAAAPLQAPIAIPAGTVFSALDGRTYTSTVAVTWPTSEAIIRIPVAAAAAGAAGNIAEGVITESPLFGLGFTVSNAAITTGRDLERDSEREARFAEYVASLSRGTVVACTYGAKQGRVLDEDGNIAEYVSRAGVVEQPGYVRIYVYSSHGAPSRALLASSQRIIDGWRDEVTGVATPGYRAGGIRFDVLGMVERAVPLAVKVKMLPGYDLDASVRQQLGDIYAAALALVEPETTLYLGAVIDLLLAATGVQQVVPVTDANIVCGANEVLTAGPLTATLL